MTHTSHLLRFIFCLATIGWMASAAAQAPVAPEVRIGDNEYVPSPVPQGNGGVNPKIPGISGDGRHGDQFRKHADGTPKMHHGIDLTAPEGTPVRAPVTGWLIPKPNNGPAGNEVRIIDEQGRVHRLMHLQDGSIPSKATYVEAGQTVASVGRTGNVGEKAPTHIHYEVRGENWNPPYSYDNSIPVHSAYTSDEATKARQYENFINSLPNAEPVNPSHPQSSPPGSAQPGSQPAVPANLPGTGTGPSPMSANEQQSSPQSAASDSWLNKAGRVVSELIFGKEAHAASQVPSAPVSPNEFAPEATSASSDDVARDNASRPSDQPQGGETSPVATASETVQPELPQSAGHISREDTIPVDDEVGDHRPGADPNATVPANAGSPASVPSDTRPSPENGAATPSGSTPGYDPAVVRPGAQNEGAQPGLTEEEFRRQMQQERERFQQAAGNGSTDNSNVPATPTTPRQDAVDSGAATTADTNGWSDSPIARRRYDDQGNRPDSTRPREGYAAPASGGSSYDEQGYYSDGQPRENRVYNPYNNTSRPIGRYDEDGNRADSPRRQYDADGYYTSGRPRQNRVYNPYNNTSRPVGSGGSSAYRQYQQFQQQSNQRINAIRNSGSSSSGSAPTVPFPTTMPAPNYFPNGSSSSSSSSSSGSSGRITFDDNAPRRPHFVRFGYDETNEKTPAVTPRQSGTSPRGAAMKLP